MYSDLIIVMSYTDGNSFYSSLVYIRLKHNMEAHFMESTGMDGFFFFFFLHRNSVSFFALGSSESKYFPSRLVQRIRAKQAGFN